MGAAASQSQPTCPWWHAVPLLLQPTDGELCWMLTSASHELRQYCWRHAFLQPYRCSLALQKDRPIPKLGNPHCCFYANFPPVAAVMDSIQSWKRRGTASHATGGHTAGLGHAVARIADGLATNFSRHSFEGASRTNARSLRGRRFIHLARVACRPPLSRVCLLPGTSCVHPYSRMKVRWCTLVVVMSKKGAACARVHARV